MKRILVTGASGFIGRHTLPELLARGYEVHAVARKPVPELLGVRWHPADLLDAETHVPLLQRIRPSHLLHLAWYAEYGKFWTSPENTRWRMASEALAEAFSAVGGQRMVSAGSCAEYDWSIGHCYEDERSVGPATPYGRAKDKFRRFLDQFGLQAGLSWAWGRIFLLYGPHEHPLRLVASVIRSLQRSQPALCSAGSQLRDFMHVADVGGAYAALLDSGVTGPVNVASGQAVSIADLVTRIGGLMGRPELIQLGALPMRPDDPPRLTADVSRLRNEVGWHPLRDLDAGLRDTIEWWRERCPAGDPMS